MNISVLGSGYAGLVTAVGLAHLGHIVISTDIDKTKINLLQQKVIPFYEPGLQELLIQTVNAGNLSFTSDSAAAIRNSEIIFC